MDQSDALAMQLDLSSLKIGPTQFQETGTKSPATRSIDNFKSRARRAASLPGIVTSNHKTNRKLPLGSTKPSAARHRTKAEAPPVPKIPFSLGKTRSKSSATSPETHSPDETVDEELSSFMQCFEREQEAHNRNIDERCDRAQLEIERMIHEAQNALNQPIPGRVSKKVYELKARGWMPGAYPASPKLAPKKPNMSFRGPR